MILSNSQLLKLENDQKKTTVLYESKLKNYYKNDLNFFFDENLKIICFENESEDFCFFSADNNKIIKTYKKVIISLY
jgi:hypothetical protein